MSGNDKRERYMRALRHASSEEAIEIIKTGRSERGLRFANIMGTTGLIAAGEGHAQPRPILGHGRTVGTREGNRGRVGTALVEVTNFNLFFFETEASTVVKAAAGVAVTEGLLTAPSIASTRKRPVVDPRRAAAAGRYASRGPQEWTCPLVPVKRAAIMLPFLRP